MLNLWPGRNKHDEIHTLNIYCNAASDQQLISDAFNDYFSSVAEILSDEACNKLHIDIHLPIDYLFNSFTNSIPSSNMKFTPHIELEKKL